MNDQGDYVGGGFSGEKANPGKRIAAFSVDFISFFLLFWVFAVTGGVLLVVVGGIVFSLYFFGWRLGVNGTSPGKQIFGLKVVDVRTGDSLGPSRGMQRAGLIWIVILAGLLFGPLVWFVVAVDKIVALVDDRGQRVTDKIVGSVVTDA